MRGFLLRKAGVVVSCAGYKEGLVYHRGMISGRVTTCPRTGAQQRCDRRQREVVYHHQAWSRAWPLSLRHRVGRQKVFLLRLIRLQANWIIPLTE